MLLSQFVLVQTKYGTKKGKNNIISKIHHGFLYHDFILESMSFINK